MSLDVLQRFIFDDSDVRGEVIYLESSLQTILANGHYPAIINRLLGEITAAAGLLSATMKFDGILNVQARGDGDLTLLMADCTRQHLLRGIARVQDSANPDTEDFTQLLGNGHLAITIDPAKGERYQGIVPLESDTLSSCIEGYFTQSEQLPTRLWLFCDGTKAGGILLQALPAQYQSVEERDDYWHHLGILTDTMTSAEFLAATPESVLTRLFHQEDLRLFSPTTMAFGCSCSESRTANMLVSLGETEVREILKEKGEIDIQCQFCHQRYNFDEHQVDELFSSNIKTLH